MSVLLENSLGITSNLEKLLTKLYEVNSLGEATNIASDIAPYKDIITKVIKRANEKVNFNDFCVVLESNSPSGTIPYQGIKYIGRESDGATPLEMKVFIVQDSSAFTEGEFISTNGAGAGVGKVLHVEEGKLLVQVTSGYFESSYSIDNAETYAVADTTITMIYSANTSYSAFLENYVDVNSTADGEKNSDLKEIVSLIKTLEIACTTKELSSGYTLETLSDSISVYGVDFKKDLIESLSNVLIKLEQARIFKFMRDNAYQRSDIVLTDSYGVNGDIASIFNDLYTRVNQSAGAIRKNSSMSGEVVVTASTNIYRAILSGSPLSEVERKIILPSEITMIEDPYASVEYLCVALNPKKDRNNAAVIYTPYSYEIQSVKDPQDFSEKVHVMSRSDIVANPLATKENDQAKSEMMEVTFVSGYENLNNVF
jgi:hypothetical protein